MRCCLEELVVAAWRKSTLHKKRQVLPCLYHPPSWD